MKEKRIKYFNEIEYNRVITELKKELPQARKLKALIELFGGLESIKEIDNMLNSKTNFSNTLLSADALGLKEEYIQVKNLLNEVDFKNYNKTLTNITDVVLAKIKENNTTYFSKEDDEDISKAEKLIAQINNLPLITKLSISKLRNNDLGFSPMFYSNNKKRR